MFKNFTVKSFVCSLLSLLVLLHSWYKLTPMVRVSCNIEETLSARKIDFSSASLFYQSPVEPCLRRTVLLSVTNRYPLTHYLFNYLRPTELFYRSAFNGPSLIALRARNVTKEQGKPFRSRYKIVYVRNVQFYKVKSTFSLCNLYALLISNWRILDENF